MRLRPLPMAVSALASAALVVTTLAGCSFSASASLTVSGEQVAKAAADALETKLPSRPEVDCGDDQVKLVDGTEVDCTYVDPATKKTVDAVVTISDVNGTKYSVNVKSAGAQGGSGDDDSSGDDASASDDDSGAPGDGSTLQVTPAEVGVAAAGSLAKQYGETPKMVYTGGNGDDQAPISISVGTTIKYLVQLTLSGKTGIGTVTITEITGSNYKLDVKVVENK
ncbi:hypothetical protein GCM10027515_19050 [Schumannella luteola]|uniref:DUF4333 domain-containing protein n=1 Tax=Schumannella luteola TaxID=472059 RepID=A0A852YRH0_9MICO|nr:DUF4333 domain-containing protein [Schumannella luteola]NYH00300.1 hypothetical protein [Schumannella luteola]